jgi:hypothetical protein
MNGHKYQQKQFVQMINSSLLKDLNWVSPKKFQRNSMGKNIFRIDNRGLSIDCTMATSVKSMENESMIESYS